MRKDGPVPVHRPDLGPCWYRDGRLTPLGYAQFAWPGGSLGHRFSYEAQVGPIGDGLTLDHLCHDPLTCKGGPSCPHRACVNPAHLEPVPLAENKRRGNSPASINARKTHCNRGHEFTEENTSLVNGKRRCLACHRLREADRHRRNRK